MTLDFIFRDCRIFGREDVVVDVGIAGQRIAAIEPGIAADAPSESAGGCMIFPGFVETHIHLDKSCILDRCHAHGSLAEAISEVAAIKRAFTEEDVYQRGRRTLEKAIMQGTTRMRTHVEVDPRIALRSFNAIRQLKRDYAWAIDLEICVFPQEGLLNDPGTDELLVEACRQGADVIGGCPYTDSDPAAQIARIFNLAREFNIDIDFHLDFDLDPTWMHLDEVCRQALLHRYGGRVAIGHVTKLSAAGHQQFHDTALRLKDAGVAVTVLPATDLFLMGRGHEHSVPRGVTPAHRLASHGVTCSVATNNVLNPFTPFGDCSLIRMANLYANVAQLGSTAEFATCFDLVSRYPARLINAKDYVLNVGSLASFVAIDAKTPSQAVAELSQVFRGFKAGQPVFSRPRPCLHMPTDSGRNDSRAEIRR